MMSSLSLSGTLVLANDQAWLKEVDKIEHSETGHFTRAYHKRTSFFKDVLNLNLHSWIPLFQSQIFHNTDAF